MSPEQRRRFVLRTLPIVAGAYASIGGFLTLIGWATGNNRLMDWENAGISMKTNTALAATFAGIALITSSFQSSNAAKKIAMGLGAVVALIGGLTLFEIITDLNVGIDTLLFDEPPGMRATFSPNRMGVPASSSFLLMGTALILLQRGKATASNSRRRKWARNFALFVALITSISLIGFLYNAQQTYTLRYTGIALQTASMLMSLAIGVIVSVDEHEPMRTLLQDSSAGLLARRALPVILILPLVLGGLRVWIQNIGLVDTPLGTALRSVVEIALLAWLLWWALAVIRARETALSTSRQESSEHAQRVIATLESISDGFFRLDREWRFMYVNAEAERISGLARADMLGKTHGEVFPGAEGSLLDREYHRAVAEQVSISFENFYEPWQRWFSVKADPTPDGGLAVFFRDVTERRRSEFLLQQSEERRRLALESAELGMWHVDPHTMELTTDDRFREIFGTSSNQIDFEPAVGVIHPDDQARVRDAVAAAIHPQDPQPYAIEYRVVHPDQSVHWVFAKGRANFKTDASGRKLASFDGTIEDITERKALEQELNSYRESLEHLVEKRTADLQSSQAKLRQTERLAAMGTLSAGLGHDLANLMFPLRMRLDILEREPLTEMGRECVTAIAASMKYLRQLGAALRQMAADPLAPPPSEGVDLAEWWAQAQGVIKAVLPRHVQLCVDIPALPRVYVAVAGLTQAVFNLVQNAGEVLASAKDATVNITAHQTSLSNGISEIVLSVQDNGPGMPAEVASRCFEPYFSTKTRAVSTGLGLALVRGVAESAGGSVEVKSTAGHGATFILHLPVAVDALRVG